MLISDQFVFLHGPKTGGTFVTEVFTQVFASVGCTLLNIHKHGRTEDIPLQHDSKQLVTTIRNPFDFYASHYCFGYWIDREPSDLNLFDEELMRERFTSYPYISFDEYVDGVLHLCPKRLPKDNQHLVEELKLGPATVSALFYSARHHLALLEKFARTGDIGPLKAEIAKTKLLHTEALNRDTYQCLVDFGVPHELAQIALMKAPVKPLNTPMGTVLERGHGQPRQAQWRELFTRGLYEAALEYEWLFFELFDEYRGRNEYSSQ